MKADTEQFLSEYPAPIAELAGAACDCINVNAAGATEKLQTGWKVVTYSHGKPFCAVAPHKQWVNVQFHEGAELPDPKSRLVGTGKSMRHVKLHELSDIDASLKALINAATKQAKN